MSASQAWNKLKYFPLAGAVVSGVTLAICFSEARKRNHVPKDLVFPSVSLVSNHNPERIVYLIGFLIVAGIFYFSSVPYTRFLLSRVETVHQRAARGVFLTLSLALIGLIVQALIPVQKDAAKMVDPDADDKPSYTLWTLVHQGGAAMFFVCSWLHMIIVLYLTRASPRLATFYSVCWWRFKLVCLVLPGVMLLVSMVYRGSDMDVQNARGFAQLTMICFVMLFYSSYAYDFSRIAKADSVATISIGDSHDGAIELQIPNRSLMSHQAPGLDIDMDSGGEEDEEAGLLGGGR